MMQFLFTWQKILTTIGFSSFLTLALEIGVSGHLPEKWRHFALSNTFLCFRVKVKFRVRVSGDTIKYVFGQTSIRASVLDTEIRDNACWNRKRKS